MKPQELSQAVWRTVPLAILPSLRFLYSFPGPILIPPRKKKVAGSSSLKELIPEGEAYSSMGSAYFNQNILNR